MATMAEKKARFIELARQEGYGSNGEIHRQDVMSLKLKYDLPYPSWLCADPSRKVRHGVNRQSRTRVDREVLTSRTASQSIMVLICRNGLVSHWMSPSRTLSRVGVGTLQRCNQRN